MAKKGELNFDQRLVLNQYIFSLLGFKDIEDLTRNMNDPQLEGLDEDNISFFYHHIANRIVRREDITKDHLLQYDQNIVRHTQSISSRRENPIVWKYFQYLSLLFTEIYLDRYFRDPETLLKDLNNYVGSFNVGKSKKETIEPYKLEELGKLAFWNATGSGKTLLMHVNIHQYLHYLKLHEKSGDLNRIILLTPNEGLSIQHLAELDLSGIEAALFDKDNRSFRVSTALGFVDIIDIHKLRDEEGEKTIAVDAFEGNNLVLVDEGHRGSSGEDWKAKRDRLCEKGFSFEYSATFGQAVKGARDSNLEQEYAKCILFDYSYKHFYKDGYGKDYKILNLSADDDKEVLKLYLTASLLSFYQQMRIYNDRERELNKFNIEKPLMIFVGGSVTKTSSKKDRTDTIEILLFFEDFVRDERGSIERLKRLISGSPGLLDERNREVFGNTFTYVIRQGFTPEFLYQDILKLIFNSSSSGNLLHIENLKGVRGEIALKLGDNEPFGVINIGNDSNLCKLCQEHGLLVTDREFSESLFNKINERASTINLLIGSKKFSEGWNSWRVSTMGLMNVGKREGAQIIQLFGRGVRLKGYNYTLKRSKEIKELDRKEIPKYIETLETLNVFGIKAEYMKQFKEYLEEEGLPVDDDEIIIKLPVIKDIPDKKLKMVRLKKGINFKNQGPKVILGPPTEYILKNKVILNYYPKLQSIQSPGERSSRSLAFLEEGKLTEEHIAFIDLDKVYFELQEYKNQRSWYNLSLSRESIEVVLKNTDWYTLYIPKEELTFTSLDKVYRWQEIVTSLLKKYCDRYYKNKKDEWESQYLEYRTLTEDDPNFFDEYKFYVRESQGELITKIGELKTLINSGRLRDFSFANIEAFSFGRHLYEPLIYLKSENIKIVPLHLNEGERDFVIGLKDFCEANPDFFTDKELYLIRNMSKGKGIGFFEAGNFYPDFILWLITSELQYIAFIDPKGLRNLEGETDPKVRFYETIKGLEERLGDPNVVLFSFIISQTPLREVMWWGGGMSEKDFESCHVLFPSATGRIPMEKFFKMLIEQE